MVKADQNNSIAAGILKTIAWFDLFDYPLTAFEIWQWGRWSGRINFEAVVTELELLVDQNIIIMRQGQFCLPERGGIIQVRRERYSFTDKKIKRAMLVSRLFVLVPWVRMVAVGNLIGSHNLRESSDIDLLVVAAKERIWLTRLFLVLIVKLLGLRPTKNKSRDTICLSFYVSEAALDLAPFSLSDDLYFTYWLAGLVIFYDQGGVGHDFYQANQWLKNELPQFQVPTGAAKRQLKLTLPGWYIATFNLFFGPLEGLARKIQFIMLAPALKVLLNKDTRVVMNDQVLKMHTSDRRAELMAKYNESLRILNVV